MFTALFVVLAVEASLTGRRLAGPLLALGCAGVAHLVAPGQMLLVVMGAYGVLLLARADQSAVRRRPARPVAVIAATHLWKRRTLLSLAAGTLTYAALLALPP